MLEKNGLVKLTNLIIGGGSQDGLYLAHFLTGIGEDVTLTYHRNKPNIPLSYLQIYDKVSFLPLDILDELALMDVLAKVRPCRVFYFAAESSVSRSFDDPELYYRVNVGSVELYKNVLLKINQNIPTVFCASSECFAGNGNNLISSKSDFKPLSPYAVSKVRMVELIRESVEKYGMCFHIAYLFNHESEFRGSNFLIGKVGLYLFEISRIYSRHTEKLELGFLHLYRDFGLASEYVEGLFILANLQVPSETVIATGSCVELSDGISRMFQNLLFDMDDFVSLDQNNRRSSDVTAVAPNIKEMLNILDWSPPTTNLEVFDVLSNNFVSYYSYKEGI